MIPKIIHYCWLSEEPYPKKIQNCINSWKEKLPDYKLILWDTKRFDVNSVRWVKEAYEAKKYAFCSDYIRLYALYNYGGIYLDSDVEVLKSYDELLNLPFFIGFEYQNYFEAATIGSEKGNTFIKLLLDYYKDKSFVNRDGTYNIEIIPRIMMNVSNERFIVKLINNINDYDTNENVINVFPPEWFSPIDTRGAYNILKTTNNTFSIHHFANAWLDCKLRFLNNFLGRGTFITRVVYKSLILLHYLKNKILKKNK